jgi:phage minor structural protein
MRDRYWYTDGKDIPFHLNWRNLGTEASQPAKLWRVSDDDKYPFKKNWRAIPEGLEVPYPAKAWLSHPGDYPFKYKWRNLIKHVKEIVQHDYITVHDIHTLQDDFDNNGITILTPISCEITEELNGVYELCLTHPLDKEGRWKELRELNIVKAEGQLFRIYKRVTSMSAGEKVRTVYARHIFYDLNDKMLQDVRPTNKDGIDFIDYIMKNMFVDDPNGYFLFYDFSYTSDITKTATSYFQNVTPVSALIGEDNCFVNRLGGELYRDNFYFSINESMEHSRHIETPIRYGIEMTDIEEDIDYSEFVTYASFKDNFGNTFAVSYVPTVRFAHNITRTFNSTYDENNMEQFVKDAQAYFGSVWRPKVTYTVQFANLRDTEMYKDFIGLQEYNVGDTVVIYSEELEAETQQKIMRKVTDAITGRAIEITLGNLQGGLTRKDKMGSTISGSQVDVTQKAQQALQEELHNTKLKLYATWETAKVNTWQEASEFTWQETKEV